MNINTQKAKKEIREKIISLFEIYKLPESKREEMITRIGKVIFQSVLIKTLPLLENKEIEEYEKLIDSQSEADIILDFFLEKVPGFLNIVREELEVFRKESTVGMR